MRTGIQNSILVVDYAAKVVTSAYDRVLFRLNDNFPVPLSVGYIKLYTQIVVPFGMRLGPVSFSGDMFEQQRLSASIFTAGVGCKHIYDGVLVTFQWVPVMMNAEDRGDTFATIRWLPDSEERNDDSTCDSLSENSP